ncbi:ammonium transporter [Gammaproteobacteria bacterium]|nr:ammonium transporter [Gammaproteobacteria bacterium]
MNEILSLRYALDTFYFLMSGALVMWMAAGFSMLESGLVRAKNTTEILTKNLALFAVSCVMFSLTGYALMYPGEGVNAFWPGFGSLIGTDNAAADVLTGTAEGWYDGAYYSVRSDFFFQVVFVATAMSIVSGSVAERMKLWPFLLFAVIMTGFIYPIQGYWKWGGGFLDAAGFNDFAGSGVVHLCGASAALAAVVLLGPRAGKYDSDGRVRPIPGSNLPLSALGALILWLGWFGFNGGSQLVISTVDDANAVANIFVNTNAAACGGLLAAMITSRFVFGKADLTMVINGAIAGLVAITAEPLTPTVISATMIGAVGGVLVFFSVLTLDKLKLDDPVGAISCHGVVGIWGLMAVPLTNGDATLSAQLLGAVSIFASVFIASFVIWFVIKKTVGIRVEKEQEFAGLDISECGLEAYPEFVSTTR